LDPPPVISDGKAVQDLLIPRRMRTDGQRWRRPR